jgi:hypothetical protein
MLQVEEEATQWTRQLPDHLSSCDFNTAIEAHHFEPIEVHHFINC